MVSVVILTHNEELTLADCLDSIAWSDDITVFDSFSSDRTPEIAKGRGVRFVQHAFRDYGAQRNEALRLPFKNEWILMLDADERIPEVLREEICARVRNAQPDLTLLRMRRKDYFMGRWIRRCSGYPTWFGRLGRVGDFWVSREVNEEYQTNGRVDFLRHHLMHYPFSKGIAHWIDRHNVYSTMEARKLAGGEIPPLRLKELINRDPAARRKQLKALGYMLPFRPIIAILYLLIARRGIIEGLPGIYFASLRGCYELMIDIKLREYRRQQGM
jgi:glycosyltransferase involved in cell wall biosynthesis